MQCIVCTRKVALSNVWCSNCVTSATNRHTAQFERQLRQYECLENAATKTLEALENLPKNILGMTPDADNRLEWSLQDELISRLRLALMS